jgi:pilus assembly protein CpaE
MNTMTGVIFTSSASLRREMEQAFEANHSFQLIQHDAEDFPSAAHLGKVLGAQAPEVVFLDMSDLSRAIDIAESVGRHLPATQMVAVGGQFSSQSMLSAQRSGIREFLTVPLRPEEIQAAVERLRLAVAGKSVSLADTGDVISFLPAKPGVGATTLCLNTASAMTKQRGNKVALLDLDLGCGNLDFLLNLDAGYSVRDLAEHASIDETLWLQMISRFGEIDVLRSGRPQPERPLPGSRVDSMLRFARTRYTPLLLDLGGIGDSVTLEALRHSNRILLVTTTDMASLHLAQRAIGVMKEQNLDDRLQLILNRVDARSRMKRSQVEELLGYEVAMTFPNYWLAIQRSLSQGHAVVPSGPLATRFAEFATLLKTPPKKETAEGGGLFSYFHRLLGSGSSSRPR